MTDTITCSDILATRAAPIQVAMVLFDAMAVDTKHWAEFQRHGPILAAAVIATAQDPRFAQLTTQGIADVAHGHAREMLTAIGCEPEGHGDTARLRLAVERATATLRRGFEVPK